MSLGRILRLDRFDRSSDAVRIKTLIVTAAVLVGLQIANFAFLFTVLGPRWDYGLVLLIPMICVFAIVLSYRYHSQFYIAGLGFSIILTGMVYFGASVGKTGIESALLPFLPMTILMAGIISGWRMTIVVGAIALGVSWLLFYQTASFSGDGTLSLALSNPVYANKFMQLALSCIMATLIAVTLSLAMHGMFKRDEQSIVKIRMAERQRTLFLSSLSHEIRTPLNGIIGMSSLLKQTNLDTQQSQYTHMVHQCGENLLEVLGTVMEFNQINYDRVVLKEELFDVHQLAHKLVRKYASRLPAGSDVIVGLHIAEQVPQYLSADKDRLETVLNHLLRNAVHFTPSGSINLLLNGSKVEDDKFKLCVYVRDTGVGIRRNEVKEIYKPFHQLDNKLTREHEGTGLGLSLCKEIIEFMNGKLDVVSEFGSGSTFFFEVELGIQSKEALETCTANTLDQAADLSNVAIFRRTALNSNDLKDLAV